MEQAMKMVRTDVGSDWFNQVKTNALTLFRWITMIVKAFVTSMFVPSEADRQIEESRERVRRYLMRS